MQPQIHHFRLFQGFAAILLILLTGMLLPACSARASFNDQGILNYGDLQVSVVEMGYDRIRDGFVCDNTNYAHPFVTLAFTCAEDAESDCKFSVLVEAKYTNGSSWGLDHFTQSDSDYLPKNLTLSPGERTEVTFQNSTKIKQCWPKSESVKRLTVALRDRSGELKDLSASYRP